MIPSLIFLSCLRPTCSLIEWPRTFSTREQPRRGSGQLPRGPRSCRPSSAWQLAAASPRSVVAAAAGCHLTPGVAGCGRCCCCRSDPVASGSAWLCRTGRAMTSDFRSTTTAASKTWPSTRRCSSWSTRGAWWCCRQGSCCREAGLEPRPLGGQQPSLGAACAPVESPAGGPQLAEDHAGPPSPPSSAMTAGVAPARFAWARAGSTRNRCCSLPSSLPRARKWTGDLERRCCRVSGSVPPETWASQGS